MVRKFRDKEKKQWKLEKESRETDKKKIGNLTVGVRVYDTSKISVSELGKYDQSS